MIYIQGESDWLCSWFGQEVVEQALAQKDNLRHWIWQHPQEIALGMRGLQQLSHQPIKASDYLSNLEPKLRHSLIIALLAS
ncbi:MAG: hypothetical protein SAL07_25770 [Oscillatoria sp. PMC 1051.18]|uniref:hypothetical protein n=1 Tax=Oscillatoria salina TaxID=331517 RepID=UPI0013BC2A88|nr:hypothetical protein [Oscillatoria salina]MBZ8181030.1 hypothetical protein [Oscillatoria salina IIICB1]MEC4896384.1 hypothetical protein [Oscillatoria sp. PMC 1050.18]MEC5033317.1 hypothetical protein [Oscillatoria sp. PMC 1051.18]NET89860.1 hypothetical protein [Kamptonema sp. SIO1D9]